MRIRHLIGFLFASLCITFTPYLYAEKAQGDQYCHLYKKIKLGMSKQDVTNIIGFAGEKGKTDVKKVFSWQEGDTFFSATEINGQFDYASLMTMPGKKTPTHFEKANQAKDIHKIETILGNPKNSETIKTTEYLYKLPNNKTIRVTFKNDSNTVYSYQADMYCPLS